MEEQKNPVDQDDVQKVVKKQKIQPDTYKKLPRHLVGITLRPWQQTVLDSVEREINEKCQKINLLMDGRSGGIGKSTIATYIGCHELGYRLPFCCVNFNHIMKLVTYQGRSPLYTVDVPRAVTQKELTRICVYLEELKTGHIYNKSKTKEIVIPVPTIWVFCQTSPKMDYLSDDKWVQWKVENNELVKI